MNEKNNMLDKAVELIEDFCMREYGEGLSDEDFADLSDVHIAHTEVEDEGVYIPIPIESIVDLENYSLKTYVAGRVISENKYDSLEDLINYELMYLDFDNLVSYDDEDIVAAVTEYTETATMENEEQDIETEEVFL